MHLISADECDYECASVINKHSQDVKSVKWNPVKEVYVTPLPLPRLNPMKEVNMSTPSSETP